MTEAAMIAVAYAKQGLILDVLFTLGKQFTQAQ